MKKPLCGRCHHTKKRHGPNGCRALRSCGPSGTFRCPCRVSFITFSELKRLSMLCETTGTYDMGGRSMRDTGIGFVDEGPASDQDTIVTEDDGSIPEPRMAKS